MSTQSTPRTLEELHNTRQSLRATYQAKRRELETLQEQMADLDDAIVTLVEEQRATLALSLREVTKHGTLPYETTEWEERTYYMDRFQAVKLGVGEQHRLVTVSFLEGGFGLVFSEPKGKTYVDGSTGLDKLASFWPLEEVEKRLLAATEWYEQLKNPPKRAAESSKRGERRSTYTPSESEIKAASFLAGLTDEEAF